MRPGLFRLPRTVVAAAALALAARRLVLFGLHAYRVPPADDHFACGYEMRRIARELSLGHGYLSPFGTGQPSAWMPPFYPFVIALAFDLFGVYSDGAALA